MNARSRCKANNRYAALQEEAQDEPDSNCRDYNLNLSGDPFGELNGIEKGTVNNIVKVSRAPKPPQTAPPKGSPF